MKKYFKWFAVVVVVIIVIVFGKLAVDNLVNSKVTTHQAKTTAKSEKMTTSELSSKDADKDTYLKAMIFYGVHHAKNGTEWAKFKDDVSNGKKVTVDEVSGYEHTRYVLVKDHAGDSVTDWPYVGQNPKTGKNTQNPTVQMDFTQYDFNHSDDVPLEEASYQEIVDYINKHGGKTALNKIKYQTVKISKGDQFKGYKDNDDQSDESDALTVSEAIKLANHYVSDTKFVDGKNNGNGVIEVTSIPENEINSQNIEKGFISAEVEDLHNGKVRITASRQSQNGGHGAFYNEEVSRDGSTSSDKSNITIDDVKNDLDKLTKAVILYGEKQLSGNSNWSEIAGVSNISVSEYADHAYMLGNNQSIMGLGYVDNLDGTYSYFGLDGSETRYIAQQVSLEDIVQVVNDNGGSSALSGVNITAHNDNTDESITDQVDLKGDRTK